jgi:hypothetical protein
VSVTARPHSLAGEVAAHREALDAFIATAEGLPAERWNARRPGDKWSPAQVAEHLRLSYATVHAELEGRGGFRVRTKWWQQRFFRFLYLPKILRRGSFPKGVPATREIRPGDGPFDRRELLDALRREGEHFLATATSDRIVNASVTHPFMGKLGLVEGTRFLTQHLRHHHAQIVPPGDAPRASAAAALST